MQETCNELYELIAKRTSQPSYKNKINFCTDGNEQNKNGICNNFNKDCVNYGQIVKPKDENGRIIGRYTRKVFGNMPFNEIGMSYIDGFCSKVRARVGCFVRKTRNFAKKRKQIGCLLHIMQTNHNFVEAENGETPAIRESLTGKVWSWNDILNVKLPFKI